MARRCTAPSHRASCTEHRRRLAWNRQRRERHDGWRRAPGRQARRGPGCRGPGQYGTGHRQAFSRRRCTRDRRRPPFARNWTGWLPRSRAMRAVADITIPAEVAAIAPRRGGDHGRDRQSRWNATGWGLMKPFLDTTQDDLARMTELQFTGPFAFFQEMVRAMAGGGSIIQISSATAHDHAERPRRLYGHQGRDRSRDPLRGQRIRRPGHTRQFDLARPHATRR